jgi:predicted CoA-binding protein
MSTPIEDFLAQRRIAIVGVSHQPKDFSRMLFRALRDRHFDVVPVNPNTSEIEGVPCYPRVQDIQPPVDAALLMTAPVVTEQVVKDCAAAGIRRVWMYRHSPAAVVFCEAVGIAVIADECPMMFLPGAGFIHRFHGWLNGRHPVELAGVS